MSTASDRRRLGIGVIGLGWMGQAHSRSMRRIPTHFPDRSFDPELVVCCDPVTARVDDGVASFGFHEGTGAWYSHMNVLYGENRFYRHVASHWIEMQQALIAMIIAGVFEFHPKLRVGFLEAQNSWAPGILSRIEWDYPQYRDTHAPYLAHPREFAAALLPLLNGELERAM